MRPFMPRKPRIVVAFDPETAVAAAAASSRSSVGRLPFGPDLFGRAGAFIVHTFSGSARFKQRNSRRPNLSRIAFGALRVIVLAHIAFVLTTSLCLAFFKTVNPAATTLMVYRAKVNGWKVQRPRFVPLSRIPKNTRTMTVRVEDGNFFGHWGIDLSAIKHAYEMNRNLKVPLYGGSTITMQTARTIFLVPEKSYLRKYLEAFIALEMEAILGKNRILELYFNYAEWGKGIFGIEAASRFHYKEGVASLSSDQTIRLVTLLSSPIRFSPYSFGRNGILWSRYAYLDKRWGVHAPELAVEQTVTPIPVADVPLSTGGEPENDGGAAVAGETPAGPDDVSGGSKVPESGLSPAGEDSAARADLPQKEGSAP